MQLRNDKRVVCSIPHDNGGMDAISQPHPQKYILTFIKEVSAKTDSAALADDPRMQMFGYTLEHIQFLLTPMIEDGEEALGSMGNSTLR